MSTNDNPVAARAAAAKSARRTALILGVLAFGWYIAFMALRLV